ncbi:MAG TPA: histidinol-phosphatase HisJ family protein [Acidimicrobiia bacterium]|nr:histidinol-phosphatase HisJ family protein [Acidimicrobiia bacterium]
MADNHLHLYPHQFPHHGHPLSPPEGPYPLERVEQYVMAAVERGVTELAFTEHFYRCFESEDVLGPFWEQETAQISELTREDVLTDRTISLESYVDVVLRAKQAGLPVLLGLEVDFFPETIDAVIEFVERYPLDVLLGSVHWIGGWGFDKPHAVEEWDRRGWRSVYEEFFRLEIELAASGAVDVLAHPDRVKMRGQQLDSEPLDLYQELVAASVSGGIAVELNSGGLRHPVEEVYPSPTLLRMFGEAGLDLTFASDAHMPDDAAWGFDTLTETALGAGFTHTARFDRRRRSFEPIVGSDPGRWPGGSPRDSFDSRRS